MLTLLERNIRALEDRLILIAPPSAEVPAIFDRVHNDADTHAILIREMQRLRGEVYTDDGAVRHSDLASDGAHRTPEDNRSWHLLIRNAYGRVSSCAWYMQHDNATSIDELRVRNNPLRSDPAHSGAFTRAIQGELDHARREGLGFAEVGGWAVSKQCRCTSEGLLLAMAGYSLGRALGGALGLTTATVRHSSSTILRRLGGDYLRAGEDVVPAYFDSRYDCQMELLRFDSRRPNPRFERVIDGIGERLSRVAVVAAQPSFATRPAVNPGLSEAHRQPAPSLAFCYS